MKQSIPEGKVQIPDIDIEDRVRLPAGQPAVIVVDMQNDFVRPGGALVVDAAADTLPRIQ
jgi:hypothetical protein